MPGVPIRLDGVLAKIEAVYGTDSVPVAGTDGVRISERAWSSLRTNYAWPNTREDVATGTILPMKPALPRGRWVEIDIAWELRGAGADLVVEAAPLFRACGMTEVDGVLKFDYSQASQLHESATIYAYAGGALYKVVGCRGNFRWPIIAGQIGVVRFLMRGLLVTDPAAAAVPVITYDNVEPSAGVNMALTIGAWTPDVIRAEFNQGVDPQRLDSANAADGIREFDYGVAAPQFTLSAKAPRDGAGILDLATYNPYADAKARTARAIALTHGAAQFARLKLAVTNAYVEMPGHGEQNQFAGWDLTYNLTDWTITSD